MDEAFGICPVMGNSRGKGSGDESLNFDYRWVE